MRPIDVVEKGGLLERIRLGELKSRELGEVLKVLDIGDAASDGRVKTPEIWRGTLGKFLCAKEEEKCCNGELLPSLGNGQSEAPVRT